MLQKLMPKPQPPPVDPPLLRLFYEALWARPLKPVLEQVPLLRRIYSGWLRQHPFDTMHGVDTSGFIPAAECAGDSGLASRIVAYAGSQPSIVRAALASLPEPARYAFVDIGCGKGRPLLVASEFPFQRVMGVELSPALAAIARSNADHSAVLHPQRTAIEIQTGDATAVAAPAERAVYFLYNAFDESLVQALVANLERQLEDRLHHLFFVYYNPVHSEVLDRSPVFERWSAKTLPYAVSELGYGPDIEDTVVIWQSLPAYYAPRDGADREIYVNDADWCSLEPV